MALSTITHAISAVFKKEKVYNINANDVSIDLAWRELEDFPEEIMVAQTSCESMDFSRFLVRESNQFNLFSFEEQITRKNESKKYLLFFFFVYY